VQRLVLVAHVVRQHQQRLLLVFDADRFILAADRPGRSSTLQDPDRGPHGGDDVVIARTHFA
jgi:hypothetical protein